MGFKQGSIHIFRQRKTAKKLQAFVLKRLGIGFGKNFWILIWLAQKLRIRFTTLFGTSAYRNHEDNTKKSSNIVELLFFRYG